jgi:polyhydroxyalkanoate synthesis repressor PhaR
VRLGARGRPAAPVVHMRELRIIKKYPNRRLYDTALSKYITLDDVRRLVLEGAEFKVIDANTEDDLTRGILLQVIMEQEHDGTPIFSTPILTQLIRFYGDAVQGLATEFLQRSLAMFASQRELYERQMRETMAANPFAVWVELTERNLAAWREMQQNLVRAATGTPRPAGPQPPAAPGPREPGRQPGG